MSVPDGGILQPLQPIAVPELPPSVPPPITHPVPVVPPLGQLPQSLPTIAPLALPDVPPPPQPVPSILTGKLPRTAVLDRIGERTLALLHAAIAEADSLLRRITDRAKAAEEEIEGGSEHPARPPDTAVTPVTPRMSPEGAVSDAEEAEAQHLDGALKPSDGNHDASGPTPHDPDDPRRSASIDEVLMAIEFFKAPARRIYESSDGSLHPDMKLWQAAGLEPRFLKHPVVADKLRNAQFTQTFFIERFTDSFVREADIASAKSGAQAFIEKLPRLSRLEPKAWLGTGLIEDVLIPLVTKEGQWRAGLALRRWQAAAENSLIRADAAIEAQDWQRRWPNPIKPDLMMQLEKEAKEARLQRQAIQKAAADDGTSDQGTLGTHRNPDDAQAKREREERDRRLRVLEEQRRRQQGLEL